MRHLQNLTLLLGAAVTALAADEATQDFQRGLVAHYTFDEGTSWLVKDRTGHGHDGTISGAIRIRSPRGYGMRFHGTTGDYVTFAMSPELELAGSMSLTAWVRIDPKNNRAKGDKRAQRLIFGDIASLSRDRCFNLRIAPVGDAEKLFFEWGDGKLSGLITADVDVLDGSWQQLAVVCDHRARKVSLHVNAQQVAQADMPIPITTTTGGSIRSGTWSPGWGLNGEIDDIRVYNRPLTPAGLRALYQAEHAGQAQADSGARVLWTGERTDSVPDEMPGKAGPVDQAGLVGHYTFDEANGRVLKDHSGMGNHGQIHGAQYVDSPWGKALRFDGKDDYVDLGQTPSLQIAGDLTIEAWLKTNCRENPKSHWLIVGSSAMWAKDRGYNLRLDCYGALRFEWADGARCNYVAKDPSFLDGNWKHVAVVVESPTAFYLYVNGRQVLQEWTTAPIVRLTGNNVHIGGWHYGSLKGDVDELRIYSRALSAREVWLNCGRKLAAFEPVVKLRGAYGYQKRAFCFDLACVTAETDLTLELSVARADTGRVVARQRPPLAGHSRPGSGRCQVHALVPAGAVAPGTYRLQAALLSDNKPVGRATADVSCVERPRWFGSSAGITDEVMPPYTPCAVERRGDALYVRTWGRTHVFAGSPFVASIESANAALLAGPMRLECTADGQGERWQPAASSVRKQSPAEVVIEQHLEGRRFDLNIHTRMEYDGLMRVDLAVEAKRAAAIDRLVLDIPLRPQHAKLLYCWPVSHSGALKQDWSSEFKPIVWIGDEERGLCWVAESEENWSPAHRSRAIEVIRTDREVTLRLNLVAEPIPVADGAKRTYTFGLQATPVRPNRVTCWEQRLVSLGPYAFEYRALKQKTQGKPRLQYLAERGDRALYIARWWDAFSYTLPLGHEQRFPKLVAACHQYGLKVVPYSIGFLLSVRAPEYEHFQAEMLAGPKRPYLINRLPGLQTQMTYFTCPQGMYQDFAVATTAECMDQYDIDGVYLDSTVRLPACRNRLHGCGYVKPDGSVEATYPVFATRQLMKRLYTVVRTRKPDGVVDAHVYDSLNVPALAFATSYWNGEQLTAAKFKPDKLPLDRFRTEFMGHNIGVPADLLMYKLGDYDACVALAIIHDVPVRGGDALARIWSAREAFGCHEARFIGYWKAAPFAKVSPKECYASLWLHPRNGVLAAVSNLSRNAATVVLEFNLDKLGLPNKVSAREPRTNADLQMTAGRVSVPLQSQAWAFVWVRAVP